MLNSEAMSKRPFDTNQSKMSRNDRFAQMSQQEKLIEQKKREIQAKLEAKRRQNNQEAKEKETKVSSKKESSPIRDAGVNQFSNDGSFLDQFKQLNDNKKPDSKFKTFNKYRTKEREREKEKRRENRPDDSDHEDRKHRNQRGRSQSPLDRQRRPSRFSNNRSLNFEPPKIPINTSFSNTITSSQFKPNFENQNRHSSVHIVPPPNTNDTLNTSPAINFVPPPNTFGPEPISFPPSTQINTLVPPPNQNMVNPNTSQLVASSVTQLCPPNIAPSLLQQPPGIVASSSQELNTSAGQIGVTNFSTQAPTLQPPIIGQTLPPPSQLFTTAGAEQIITAPPQVLMNVPPPQIVQQTQLVLTPQTQNVLVSAPASILTTVTLPAPVITQQNITAQNTINVRPPGLATVELTSIPPPNPIQVQNIPQPEPINTLNIPPPAPLQVQNIPTPSSLQLNEIPNPKPLDLMAIPTPNEGGDTVNKITVADPDFIKNIPPPNKSIPPPSLPDVSTSLPPPNAIIQTTFLGNPAQQGLNSQLNNQGILIHTIGQPGGHIQGAQGQQLQVAGPPPITTVPQTPPPSSTAPRIPSLMSQTVLPPPGMSVNVPPPNLLQLPSRNRDMSQPPPNFVAPPGLPPITTQLPNMSVPPPLMAGSSGLPPRSNFKDQMAGGAEFEAMANLAKMVAECGPSVEDVVRQKKNQDPDLWFLFHKDSAAYRQYANLVEQYKKEKDDKERMEHTEVKPDPSEMYEPEMALEDDDGEDIKNENIEIKMEIKQETMSQDYMNRRDRKRKSRWGDKDPNIEPPGAIPIIIPPVGVVSPGSNSALLSKVTRTDPGLMKYAIQTYGSANLSEEDWKKAEDNYKIHLLYQDMIKKREELERLQRQGKNKYEYDSDEEIDGGTWEHKLREKEMQATERWATELTRQAEGKHHIGDFLPPEEMKRFLEKSNAVKEGRQPNFSDYKEFKIKEDNIGFKMLQKLGWSEGQGLGQNNAGIVEPINKGAPRESTQGLGLNVGEATEGEDEYESYRKRMMLAYRFRPNPLNNPRRPYY